MSANAASTSRAPIGASVLSARRRVGVTGDLPPVLTEVPQQAHAYARGAWFGVVRGDVGLLAVGVGSTRDVQVDPRDVCHELLQEQRRGDRTSATSAGVAH